MGSSLLIEDTGAIRAPFWKGTDLEDIGTFLYRNPSLWVRLFLSPRQYNERNKDGKDSAACWGARLGGAAELPTERRSWMDVPPEVRVKGALCSLFSDSWTKDAKLAGCSLPRALASPRTTGLPLSWGALLMLAPPIGLAITLHTDSEISHVCSASSGQLTGPFYSSAFG